MNINEKIEKPNYKIWHFGASKWDRVVDKKFYAIDDAAAYKQLQDFLNYDAHNIDAVYYYSTLHYVCTIDSNGKKSEEFDIDDRCHMARFHHKHASWISRALDSMIFFFSYYFISRPKDFYYWARDLVYLLKNKEAYSNQWNLDWHLLDSIEKNVPSLIKNSHALAFIDEAIIKLYGNDPKFDLDEYHRAHCMGYPKEVEDLAIKIQNEEYSNLLLHVKLYKYYANFGSIDFDNKDEVEFDKKWRHTIPFKKGTYDEIADYKQANALSKEQWNKIWDWMKAHGQKLND